MILYVQDENYHFDGHLSGVIVDDNKVALFQKDGISEPEFNIDKTLLKWYDLDNIEEYDNNCVKIKAKNFSIYKDFQYLNKLEIN